MRIKITFAVYDNGRIDFNYQHQIQAVIYKFLSNSNPDYASWLHEEGYVYKKDQRFKFFVYSGIIFNGPIKTKSSNSSSRLNGLNGLNRLNGLNNLNSLPGFCFHASSVSPFTFSFQIASPVNKFLQHLIQGIFKEGQEITLGQQRVIVYRVESLTDPLNGLSGLSLKPLESPIFIKKPMPSGQRDMYLFPGDDDYEVFLNQNLIHKYETLYGKQFEGELLKFDFQIERIDQFKRLEQLERLNQFKRFEPKLFKSFKVYKAGKVTGEIKGTLKPFTVSGSKELIKIGLECGLGQNNSLGCGYVEVVQAGTTVPAVQTA